jgi:predicted metalloprotease with PDZ domain
MVEMRMSRLLLIVGLALGPSACTTSPIAPIPPPLPETMAWATGGSAGGGGFLGLKTRENVGRSFEDLGSAAGIRVSRVVENSPAAEAGFEVGDVILAFGEHATDDPGTLDALVEAGHPKTEVALSVQRGDTVFEVPVTLGALGTQGSAAVEPEVIHRLDPARSRAGWVTGHEGVVLVTSVPEGPFPRAGVPVKSVVHAIDGVEVFSDRALIRRLQECAPGDKVEVAFVDPKGEARVETVVLQDQKTKVTKAKIPIIYDFEADTAGERKYFSVLNLWIIWLFRYERSGAERHYSILRFFRFSTGVGELSQ